MKENDERLQWKYKNLPLTTICFHISCTIFGLSLNASPITLVYKLTKTKHIPIDFKSNSYVK